VDFWEVDCSEPIIAPEAVLAYYREMTGRSDLTLPETLVATFQTLALNHMASELGVELKERWPTPIFWQMARASVNGHEIAIARLPVGAPSAAAALELMIAAGVRRVLVAGSAGSLQPNLPAGSLLLPTRAVRHEGSSHHYLPAGEPAEPSTRLLGALASAASERGLVLATGPVWTTDAPYRECTSTILRLREEGVLAVEMESAALFAVARHRGAEAALVLAISDELGDTWKPGFHTLAYRRGLLAAANLALETALKTDIQTG
jgi:uridine phosphorylase